MTKSPRAVAREALRWPGRPCPLTRRSSRQGLHPAPALRRPGPEDLPQGRLPGRRPGARGLRRAAPGPGPGRGPALLDPLLRRQAAAKKGEFVVLLFRATARAREGGLIGPEPTAAVDATGLESRHTSRYFFNRAGRKHGSRVWTKLTVACDTASHFLAGARVSLGPANDAPQFRPVMAQASLAVGYDRVLADAAFDSEASHRYCREELGVRSTVIPLNRRGQGANGPGPVIDARWSSGSANGLAAAGTGACTGSAGRRRAPSRGTSTARIGPARQVGRVARARVLPACTHPQPHAPRRYRVEGFNRAFDGLWAATWTMCVGEFDLVARLCARWDIELGPTEPRFEDEWPITPDTPPAFAGLGGVLAESHAAIRAFRERRW